jgi:hypothetical protein
MKLPKTKRGWVGLGCASIFLLFIACSALGALTGGGASRQQVAQAPAPTEGAAAAAPAAPAATEGPTAPPATEAPTATPSPVPPTPEPTNTPEPTATLTPVPPQEFSDSGKKVEEVQIDVVSTLTFSHDGARNFQVWAYGEGDQKELLVNTIGGYQGVRWLAPGAYSIEIDADGAWTMTIAPMGLDPAAAGAIAGTGDYVSGIFPSTRGRQTYTFTHDGQANFQVWRICATGRDLVVNEIGAFDGETVVRSDDNVCFWDISADGAWTAAPKE